MIRTLLIDNHDSFTWNLVHDLTRVNGVAPVVVANDWAGWASDGRELLGTVDNVVISPGPGTPLTAADVGICPDVVRAAVAAEVPVLGICLGHQLIAHMYGATVGPAAEPVHGRLSRVEHDGRDLFHGLPAAFDVVRYHSLAVSDVPPQVTVTARSADGTVMGLHVPGAHLWGVQFHPESVKSSHGRDLLANFAALTRSRGRHRTVHHRSVPLPDGDSRLLSGELFRRLHGGARATDHAVWLDGNRDNDPRARFSVMGASDAVVTADVAAGTVTVTRDGRRDVVEGDVLRWLQDDLARWRTVDDTSVALADCGFRLGWVGYLGYGLKQDCLQGEGADNGHPSRIPDAALVFLERAVVIDHESGTAHLLSLAGTEDAGEGQWQEDVAAVVRNLTVQPEAAADGVALTVGLHDRDSYTAKVREIQRLIRAGETYEACLTTTLTATQDSEGSEGSEGSGDSGGPGDPDTLELYRRLRRDNPAPFGAYLRLPGATVMSTSPERFLRVDAHGRITSSPIKGTRPVAEGDGDNEAIRAELRSSEKDRAENLMIVDLVRHDLGRVAAPGSVEVPEIFSVESYATVHQLVSTVTATLSETADAVDAVRAAFPPGSMTGAPKERTVRILDALEDAPRGVYSGAVGYFSLNGAVDLSVVIRTLVAEYGTDGACARLTYGVGGAVVSQSTPDGEYDETVVKAAPVRSTSLGGHAQRWGTR
ncbi:chorismate-binding protein [Corynebacterium sp.]|uniref:chorismate-binding protein n=1 Tax=Corynebacterium sp. TaxID=1720 RepID=UPI003B3A20D8